MSSSILFARLSDFIIALYMLYKLYSFSEIVGDFLHATFRDVVHRHACLVVEELRIFVSDFRVCSAVYVVPDEDKLFVLCAAGFHPCVDVLADSI